MGHQQVYNESVKKKLKAISAKHYQQSPIILNESLSFVQQTPWIQNKTIQKNILFGEKFNKKKY